MEGGWEPNMVDRRQRMELPPGFRFHPTDEELVTHYLSKKAVDASFQAWAIAEADLNKCEPWDLPLKAKMGEKQWYFFCLRDRKYPTGLRTNRATDAGYWKATGKDKEIHSGRSLVGMKKTLVFYMGRAPKGEKTNWVMHEFRLEGSCSSVYNLPPKSDWVICRVFNKSPGENQATSGLFLPAPAMEISGVARGPDAASVPCFSTVMEGCYHPFSWSQADSTTQAQQHHLLRRAIMASTSLATEATATDHHQASNTAAEISSMFPKQWTAAPGIADPWNPSVDLI